jgi:hypothetical protein
MTQGADEVEAPRGVESEPLELPDLQETTFSPEQLTRYIEELSASGTAVEVSIKGTAREKAEAEVTLASLLSKFVDQRVHAAQLRYALGGSSWVDTLISGAEGVRLVRMQR